MEREYFYKLKKITSLFDTDKDGNILFGNEIILPKYSISKDGLTDKLAGIIYSNCYCRNEEYSVRISEGELAKINDEAFLAKINGANTSTGLPSEKWQVNSYMPNGDPLLSKGIDAFSVNCTEVIIPDKSPNQHGIYYAAIKNRKSYLSDKNSFYYIFSDNPESKKNAPLLRFYWNIDPVGISILINQLTTGLNKHFVPFQFKCLKHPNLYTRNDACVLYVFPKYLHITCQIIRNFIDEIQQFLNVDVPMFTLKLRDGLSFAESPAGGQSFGMQHSKILSSSLLTAFEQGMNAEQKLSHVIDSYSSLGYKIAEIYKNPGSIFNYSSLKQTMN